MTSETDNSKKLQAYFNKEYAVLKAFVNSKIRASVNRDAEDIIQDVALKLFSGADSYSPIKNVAGFVYHSLRNKIIDIGRTNKNSQAVESDNEARFAVFAEEFYQETDNLYSEEIKDHLKRTILSLKPVYRDIILAVDYQGYSYKEISEETGIPEGTLMSRRHRAISILYKKIKTKKI